MSYFKNLNVTKSEVFFINLFRDEERYDETLSDEEFLSAVFAPEEELEIAKQFCRDTW